MTEKLLFYDIEVFHKGLFLVTQDEAGNVRKYFRDEKGADRGFLNFKRAREDIKGYTLVGFNNYFYDDHILPLMYNGVDTESVKKMSDKLIGGEVKTLPTDVPNKTLDCMQQIDNSYPGLKKIEANMGRSVFESSIPFDKSDSFSDEEVAETFEYCAYDVASTEKVYELRKDNYFGAKSFLISMLPSNDKWLQEHAINWNTTTIGAKVLLGKSRLDKWAEPYFDRKNLIAWEHPLYQEVPKEVLDLWKADDGGNVVINNFDNEIVFGFGGIHSTNTTKRDFEDVTNIDVTSLYPNLIIKLGVLGEHTDKFATMVRERVGHKKTNKPLAAAEKIVINSVYGLLDAKFSAFYNHYAANAIRFYGQCALYKLAKQISQYATIVQLNTDGMAYQASPENQSKVEAIYKAWSAEQGLNLERSHFTKIIQKDVNNYIAIKDGGHLKVKGKDVARYDKNMFFRNNSTRIVDKAVTNYFVNGVPVEKTVNDNLDKPLLFQFVLQAGNTFAGTFDQNGKKYNKVNRVFAGLPDNKDTVQLLKKYAPTNLDKAGKPRNPVKYATAPENMLVHNEPLDDVHEIEGLDVQFYVDLCNNALRNWETGGDAPKPTKKRKAKPKGVTDYVKSTFGTADEALQRFSQEDVDSFDFEGAASDLIANGLKIYPLSFGSSAPLKGSHGAKDATADPKVLVNWQGGQRKNIALALHDNDLFLLDLDINHASGTNGIASLGAYMKEHKVKLPPTYYERTPSGGYHYFFSNPGGGAIDTNITDLFDDDSGVDIQVSGTPVYPSVKAAESGDYGQYTHPDDAKEDIAEAPIWLITLINQQLGATRTAKNQEKKLGQSDRVAELLQYQRRTIDADRNDGLFNYGRLLRSLKMTKAAIAEELMTFNETNIDPPLPAAEVLSTTKSVTRG